MLNSRQATLGKSGVASQALWPCWPLQDGQALVGRSAQQPNLELTLGNGSVFRLHFFVKKKG